RNVLCCSAKIVIQDEVVSMGDYGTFSQPEHQLAVTTSYSFWRWATFIFAASFGAAVGLCFLIWVAPFFIDKEVIPILKWENETFSKPVLAVLIFASVALFPSILLPSTPSIFGSVFLYMDCSFLINKEVIPILKWETETFSKPVLAVLIFASVALFPSILLPSTPSIPYLFGTLVGMLPEIFIAIYTGIMISSLADTSNDDRTMSTPQIVCTVVGFLLTVVTTAGVTVYTKRRLSKSRDEDEPLL
nr:hypothetical protein [Tanacetum cinerariifolium]